jgi:hypothetical protein
MRGLWVSLLALVASIGCSGDDSGGGYDSGGGLPAACTSFAACGGNVVGNWNLAALCGPASTPQVQNPLGAQCPSATAAGAATATGTVTFNADLTYTSALTATGTATITVPKSCLNGTTCAAFQTLLQGQPSSTMFSSINCPDDGTSCDCTFTAVPETSNETGTYAIAGTTITLTPTGGAAGQPTPYCVNGNELSMQSMGSDGTLGVFVFNKN